VRSLAMRHPTAAIIGLVVLAAYAARADAPPEVQPFLTGDEYGVLAVTGQFGPGTAAGGVPKETIIVTTFEFRGPGSYHGFALVADSKAAHGYRKLPLPPLPSGAELGTDHDGEMKVALVADLDKTPGDELVLQLAIVCCPGASGTWMAVTYVVLHWDGKQFVRVGKLEQQLAKALAAKNTSLTNPLTDTELRSALHVDDPAADKPR
jgi:hypothetical protein